MKGFTSALEEQHNKKGLSFELKDSPDQNILSDVGWQLLMMHCMRAKCSSTALIGIVCSTWLWVCKGSTGRCDDQPMGNMSSKPTQAANTMVSRALLLISFLACRRCFFIVEQPSASSLASHTRFAWLEDLWVKLADKYQHMQWWQMRQLTTWLGLFGHESCKPTKLWGTPPWMPSLKRKLTQPDRDAIASKGKNLTITQWKAGKKKVYGNKKAMKSSQSYPQEFTDFIAAQQVAFENSSVGRTAEASYDDSSSESDFEYHHADDWDDCQLTDWIASIRNKWATEGYGCLL